MISFKPNKTQAAQLIEAINDLVDRTELEPEDFEFYGQLLTSLSKVADPNKSRR